jgi:hypothetical protein
MLLIASVFYSITCLSPAFHTIRETALMFERFS